MHSVVLISVLLQWFNVALATEADLNVNEVSLGRFTTPMLGDTTKGPLYDDLYLVNSDNANRRIRKIEMWCSSHIEQMIPWYEDPTGEPVSRHWQYSKFPKGGYRSLTIHPDEVITFVDFQSCNISPDALSSVNGPVIQRICYAHILKAKKNGHPSDDPVDTLRCGQMNATPNSNNIPHRCKQNRSDISSYSSDMAGLGESSPSKDHWPDHKERVFLAFAGTPLVNGGGITAISTHWIKLEDY